MKQCNNELMWAQSNEFLFGFYALDILEVWDKKSASLYTV